MPAASQDSNGNVTLFSFQTYSGTGGTPVSSGNVLTSTNSVGNATAYASTR